MGFAAPDRHPARERAIEFVGAYRWLDFLNDDQFLRDLDTVTPFLGTLQGIGVTHLIVADSLREQRVALAGLIPTDGTQSLDAAGYVCAVRGAQLRFAWFRAPAQLDARFKRTFASCRTVSYLRVCRGSGGSAIRYADPRFVLEVAAQPVDRAVLLRLPFNPSKPMMRGTAIG